MFTKTLIKNKRMFLKVRPEQQGVSFKSQIQRRILSICLFLPSDYKKYIS